MSLPRITETPRFAAHRGCRLAYSRAGQGTPVLLIQGTAVHGDGWMPQIEELSVEHECLWFDNRGMSASQPIGDAEITVEQMAEDARVLLDEVGWERVHVVGHSLGGCIAQELALSAPERVRTLSLLCTAADGSGLVKMSAAMLWRGLRMQFGTLRSRRRAFLEIVLTEAERADADLDAVAAELAEIFGHDLAVRPPVTMKQVRAMSKWSATERLGELAAIPTLVVGAAHDLIARPPLVSALAAGIPGAVAVTLDDAAHGCTVTHAERINALLREHFHR